MIKHKIKITFKMCLFYAIVLLTGVCVGSLAVGVLLPDKCADIVSPLKNVGQTKYWTVFCSAFLLYIKPAIFMWIAGFFSISVYCNILAVFYKGTVLGLTIGAILKVYGVGNGMLVSICGILPQYFVFIPVLIYICIATFEFSKSQQKPKRKLINYVMHLIIALTGCLLVALTDTYVTSLLLRLCMIGE